jgi:hypothetical protein
MFAAGAVVGWAAGLTWAIWSDEAEQAEREQAANRLALAERSSPRLAYPRLLGDGRL